MSYFEDQDEAWWDGGREWYADEQGWDHNDPRLDVMPGDFDPFVFWAETSD